MAALPDPAVPVLIDLREISPDDLRPLMESETAAWQRHLFWDFRPAADLVRRFLRMQALHGYALAGREGVVGYSYYVCEDGKGLIGDLFVKPERLGEGLEQRLLSEVVRQLWVTPGVMRIEAQLILLSSEGRNALPFRSHAQVHPRNFMIMDLPREPALAPRALPARFSIGPWHEREQGQAARLIAGAYAGHVDARINSQYRSVSGARRFLSNIVQYPGCGSFFQTGSFVLVDQVTEQLAGLVLASLVAFDSGHITQICVDPSRQGLGIGAELLRRSIEAMRAAGCRRVSLTVTAVNSGAIALYERMGFRLLRQFDAYVWESLG